MHTAAGGDRGKCGDGLNDIIGNELLTDGGLFDDFLAMFTGCEQTSCNIHKAVASE